jgi:hypothetical protein
MQALLLLGGCGGLVRSRHWVVGSASCALEESGGRPGCLVGVGSSAVASERTVACLALRDHRADHGLVNARPQSSKRSRTRCVSPGPRGGSARSRQSGHRIARSACRRRGADEEAVGRLPRRPGEHRRVRLRPLQFGQDVRIEKRAHDRRGPLAPRLVAGRRSGRGSSPRLGGGRTGSRSAIGSSTSPRPAKRERMGTARSVAAGLDTAVSARHRPLASLPG